MLQKFLSQAHITIVAPSVVYAALQLYCIQRGKALSHNDIWIAALASEADDMLVTFDQDFSVFSELWGISWSCSVEVSLASVLRV